MDCVRLHGYDHSDVVSTSSRQTAERVVHQMADPTEEWVQNKDEEGATATATLQHAAKYDEEKTHAASSAHLSFVNLGE